eukprot:COSAG01_NODE_1095_length_11714_cov_9.062930_3_plen_230_part_00
MAIYTLNDGPVANNFVINNRLIGNHRYGLQVGGKGKADPKGDKISKLNVIASNIIAGAHRRAPKTPPSLLLHLQTPRTLLRVRVEIMGPGKYEDVGKSQSVIVMINPIISTRTRILYGFSCSLSQGTPGIAPKTSGIRSCTGSRLATRPPRRRGGPPRSRGTTGSQTSSRHPESSATTCEWPGAERSLLGGSSESDPNMTLCLLVDDVCMQCRGASRSCFCGGGGGGSC